MIGLLRSGILQAKLHVNRPGDRFEQEADRMADAVLRMPAPTDTVQRCAKCEQEEQVNPMRSGIAVQRKCAQCEEEEKHTIQAKEVAEGASARPSAGAEAAIAPALSGGHQLPDAMRSFFEPRMGADFSRVRVHTGQEADRSAQAIGARAYTVGSHIVFGAGEYAPQTSAGRQLLAHELVHVIQQRESDVASQMVQRTGSTCPANWSTTVAADHAAALTMMDNAIAKLGAYNGTAPADVYTAMSTNFHTTSTWRAGIIRFNLSYVRRMAPLASYQCENNVGGWWCGPTTLAETLWCVPAVDIRICSPLYFGQPPRERSATLVHEWMHKYNCSFDLGYSGEPGYAGHSTTRSIHDADAYSELVKAIG